jgi:hypothetical protein
MRKAPRPPVRPSRPTPPPSGLSLSPSHRPASLSGSPHAVPARSNSHIANVRRLIRAQARASPRCRSRRRRAARPRHRSESRLHDTAGARPRARPPGVFAAGLSDSTLPAPSPPSPTVRPFLTPSPSASPSSPRSRPLPYPALA